MTAHRHVDPHRYARAAQCCTDHHDACHCREYTLAAEYARVREVATNAALALHRIAMGVVGRELAKTAPSEVMRAAAEAKLLTDEQIKDIAADGFEKVVTELHG